jgi:AraC-like DNA-binding protein
LRLRQLGGLLVMAAIATALIGLTHGPLRGESRTLASHLTQAGHLAFWMLFVLWIRSVAGVRTRAVVVTVVAGAASLYYWTESGGLAFVPRFVWLLPAGTMATAYGWWTVYGRVRPPANRLVVRVLVFGSALTVAQTIRTLWPAVDALREVVPVALIGGFLVLIAGAVRDGLVRASTLDDASAPVPRYARSGLASAAVVQLAARLDEGMRSEKWFRDVNLSLSGLASRLGVSPQAVSQALSQGAQSNFSDYIAGWRVQEAQQLLSDPAWDRLTVDALAESAGFASRSAFYKAFRRLTGETPTAYRRRIRVQPGPVKRPDRVVDSECQPIADGKRRKPSNF